MPPGRLSRKMAIFVLMRSFYSSIVLGGLVLGCIGCGQIPKQDSWSRMILTTGISLLTCSWIMKEVSRSQTLITLAGMPASIVFFLIEIMSLSWSVTQHQVDRLNHCLKNNIINYHIQIKQLNPKIMKSKAIIAAMSAAILLAGAAVFAVKTSTSSVLD